MAPFFLGSSVNKLILKCNLWIYRYIHILMSLYVYECICVYIYIPKNILYNVIDKTLQILEQPINKISSKLYRMLTKDRQSVLIYIYIYPQYAYLLMSYNSTYILCYIFNCTYNALAWRWERKRGWERLTTGCEAKKKIVQPGKEIKTTVETGIKTRSPNQLPCHCLCEIGLVLQRTAQRRSDRCNDIQDYSWLHQDWCWYI